MGRGTDCPGHWVKELRVEARSAACGPHVGVAWQTCGPASSLSPRRRTLCLQCNFCFLVLNLRLNSEMPPGFSSCCHGQAWVPACGRLLGVSMGLPALSERPHGLPGFNPGLEPTPE